MPNVETAKTVDVLGLGCNAVDEFLYLSQFPEPDAKVRIQKRRRQCGGQTVNALIAAARLGSRCSFAGILGTGEDSQFLHACLDRNGIATDQATCQAGIHPIRSTILVAATTNTRTVLYDLDHTAGASPSAPTEDVIQACRVLHVDHYGIEGMTRAARIARSFKIPIVADFEQDSGPGFAELLALIDHLILAKDFAGRITGTHEPEKIIEYLWNENRQVVVITAGKAGCWYREQGQPTVGHFPAFAVLEVDSTGCGDVFHGVYAAMLARQAGLMARLTYASAAGALMATREGTSDVIPTAVDIADFLQQHQSRID